MRSVERRKVNALEMKRLQSLVSVSRLGRVWKEGVRRRAGIERELAINMGQRVGDGLNTWRGWMNTYGLNNNNIP